MALFLAKGKINNLKKSDYTKNGNVLPYIEFTLSFSVDKVLKKIKCVKFYTTNNVEVGLLKENDWVFVSGKLVKNTRREFQTKASDYTLIDVDLNVNEIERLVK